VTMAGDDAPTTGDPPERTRRAVVALSAWTAVVAVPGFALSGTVAFWGAHDHLSRAGSGPAAVLASDTLTLFLTTVLGTAVVLPLLVAGTRLAQPDTSGAATAVGAVVGVAGPFGLAATMGLLLGLAPGRSTLLLAVTGGGLLAAVLAVGSGVEVTLRRLSGTTAADGGRPDAGDARPWLACCWNYWLVGALVLGAVGGGLVGAPLGGAVETWSGTPQASFDYETTETANGTRLTVTHDGGDEIPAAGLRLTGNLTAVPGANQTHAGPWNGSTTHIEQTFRPGPHVAPGDQVAVGVPEGCVVRVVWEGPAGDSVTLGKYTCGEDGER
jgi:hypothetical protein